MICEVVMSEIVYMFDDLGFVIFDFCFYIFVKDGILWLEVMELLDGILIKEFWINFIFCIFFQEIFKQLFFFIFVLN